MIKNIKSIRTTAICLLMAGLLGCAKTEKGPQGDPGPQGAEGAPGNANVVTTNSVTLSNWVYDSDGDIYTVSINASVITQAVKDKGLIMVYLLSENNDWVPLPYVGLSSPTDFLTYRVNTGNVLVSYYDNVEPTENPSSFGIICKVVVIPSAALKVDVNYTNYEQVKKEYCITE